jgi:SAM-dependent methyltransferase
MAMGIDINGAKFLAGAARSGVMFDTCAMLGRQEIHVTPKQMKGIFRLLLQRFVAGAIHEVPETHSEGFAESFLERCGAKKIVSFDNSSYEGASIIHNMNRPLPDAYDEAFDCVIDGGTLEHIFNLPVALQNCMRMVKAGGHFLAITPCNNFMGHGFYQFSPELYYGVFSERNGFKVEQMFIFESRPDATWYSVANPAILGGRVELVNAQRTYLLVRARRMKIVPLDDITPQQSDYVTAWATELRPVDMPALSSPTKLIMRWKGRLKCRLRKAVRLLPIESLRTPFRSPWYERWR